MSAPAVRAASSLPHAAVSSRLRQRSPHRRLITAAFEALESRRMFDGGGEPEPIFPDAFEPNNSFAAATNLGNTNTASLAGLNLHNTPVANDTDYFKFTAASTGTVGVVITFFHVEGNLQLTAYNSAQQQIAHSNSSTLVNNRESFALNVTAGQTYFIRAHGALAGTSQPDYALDMQPLSVAFDWSMRRRFGNRLDAWGLPIIPNTPGYARPNPVLINNIETPQFGVTLDASASFLGSNNVTYTWDITGPGVTRQLVSASPLLTTDLPEGQYSVTLTASVSGGPTLSTAKQIKVVDHLIVAMGDSYGSGEGNPHAPQQFDAFGFVTSGAKWAQGDNDDAITNSHRRSHRSSWAGVAKAALDLENSDPKSSVTFVFLSHTGATIPAGMLGSQDSSDPGAPGSDPAQVNQLASIVGSRRIDGLVMSIGGNDAGFFDIAARLVAAEPSDANYQSVLQDIWADAASYRSALVQSRYPALRNALIPFDIGQVFLTEYPDPTRDASGGTAARILHDIADGFEIDQFELERVRENVMVPLLGAMARFARDSGWNYVTDIASAFATHGYGDWFRTASESVILQGPVFNRNFPSVDEKAQTTGTLHPTPDGQAVYRNRVNSAFNQPNLVTRGFALTPNAFAQGAVDGYELMVQNQSLLGSSPPSVARIYLSTDGIVNTSDFTVIDVPVPALAPGQLITLTGVLPHASHVNFGNLAWVAPVLDIHNQVAESNESDNLPITIQEQSITRPDRDLHLDGTIWRVLTPQVQLGATTFSRLGYDELAGKFDMDFFPFQASAGQRLSFDIDALDAGGLNTHIRIYRMNSDVINTFQVLAMNDDGRAPGEPTANNGESFLRHTFAQDGQYCLVVAHALNAVTEPTQMLARLPGGEGDYTLTIADDPIVPVAVTGSQFNFNDAPQRLTISFSANVGASLTPADLQLVNISTNQVIPTHNIALSYSSSTNTAIFTFPGYAYGALPDGYYRATLPAGSVTDSSGNPLPSDYVTFFQFLNGDANADGRVNLTDFNILASNFGQTNRNFSHGDFTYDGVVNLSDFNVLAARFGTALAPQSTGASGSGAASAGSRLIDTLRDDVLA